MREIIIIVPILILAVLAVQNQYIKGMEKATKFWNDGNIIGASKIIKQIHRVKSYNYLIYN